ncbi:glycosyltransferase [Caproicibacterium sp. BJN0003]|uniref:glycosyltransferase n=1 Tax=Caproicibacterium sp. BJN0003 TaxID=2994078 RepID=UPI00225B351A|nr:glycosyltransferase [Caproicibacterium sp. BJN0003]UZT81970.1 glycosyltransferase [Caproicibacterium sp. BJN0003]
MTKRYINNKTSECSKPLRVLYIINSFSWGGAEKLVYDLSIGLIKKAEFVGVIALYRQDNDTETKMIADLKKVGVKTAILGKTAGKGRIKSIYDIYQFGKINRVNIIHGHCSVPMLFAKIAGKMLRVPVVCTIHNTRGYSAKREKNSSWMVSKYVSIGQAVENYMIQELNIKKNNIVPIFNSINTEQFPIVKKDPNFWVKYGGKKGEQVILNVARVHQQKNQLCLARAINRCIKDGESNIRAYILGNFDESDQTYIELRKYIENEGIADHIIFLGMHQNVNDFLHNADCFVMTSKYEGLSVAFLEAVISGLAIVVTDMPFVRELNSISNCSTVIQQDDDKALASILEKKSYKQQSLETISLFKEKFSMKEFVDQHYNLYKKVLDSTVS